jgi:hypothetical protein
MHHLRLFEVLLLQRRKLLPILVLGLLILLLLVLLH